MNRKINAFAAWIACLAILMAAFAPSISHAIAAEEPTAASLHEFCTADGIKTVVMENGNDASSLSPVQEAMHFEHCPFCLTNATAFALPTDILFSFSLEEAGRRLLPFLFYRALHTLFAWSASQPRAPPLLP